MPQGGQKRKKKAPRDKVLELTYLENHVRTREYIALKPQGRLGAFSLGLGHAVRGVLPMKSVQGLELIQSTTLFFVGGGGERNLTVMGS